MAARMIQHFEQVEIATVQSVVADCLVPPQPRHIAGLAFTEVAKDPLVPAILIAVLATRETSEKQYFASGRGDAALLLATKRFMQVTTPVD